MYMYMYMYVHVECRAQYEKMGKVEWDRYPYFVSTCIKFNECSGSQPQEGCEVHISTGAYFNTHTEAYTVHVHV